MHLDMLQIVALFKGVIDDSLAAWGVSYNGPKLQP